jgi:hypothetical protein
MPAFPFKLGVQKFSLMAAEVALRGHGVVKFLSANIKGVFVNRCS